jgi:ubiquinone biosynthesis protein Coq4
MADTGENEMSGSQMGHKTDEQLAEMVSARVYAEDCLNTATDQLDEGMPTAAQANALIAIGWLLHAHLSNA